MHRNYGVTPGVRTGKGHYSASTRRGSKRSFRNRRAGCEETRQAFDAKRLLGKAADNRTGHQGSLGGRFLCAFNLEPMLRSDPLFLKLGRALEENNVHAAEHFVKEVRDKALATLPKGATHPKNDPHKPVGLGHHLIDFQA